MAHRTDETVHVQICVHNITEKIGRKLRDADRSRGPVQVHVLVGWGEASYKPRQEGHMTPPLCRVRLC
jgi:hypothetical protein